MTAVIIPVKDEEKVFECIDRVKEQDPDEIIVVDAEASDPDYSERLRSVDGITYVQEGGGTATARNLGAEAAESDRLLFLDADCYPEDGWLDEMERGLDEAELVEGRVEYIGERCPFNRIVENRGAEERFLTANLGVRAEVFDDVAFDPEYSIFREDTDFGWRALRAGYESTFVDATVEHDAGRHTFGSFVGERLRYVSEPYFVERFRGDDRLEREVNHAGPVLYPLELAAAAVLIATVAGGFLSPLSWVGTAAVAAGLSTYYTVSKMRAKAARFCPLDWVRGLWFVPLALLVKRYALWRGALKYNVFLV